MASDAAGRAKEREREREREGEREIYGVSRRKNRARQGGKDRN